MKKLKINRLFIREIPGDEEGCSITRTIMALAKNLAINVIAEGGEEPEQWDFLLENGCEEIQGYFYGRPAGAEQAQVFIEQHNKRHNRNDLPI